MFYLRASYFETQKKMAGRKQIKSKSLGMGSKPSTKMTMIGLFMRKRDSTFLL
jgi:hypothetical protein